jgi:hypothetical protein
MAHPTPVMVHLAQPAPSLTMGVTVSPVTLELVLQLTQPHNSCNIQPSVMDLLPMPPLFLHLSHAPGTTTTVL